MKFPCFSKVQCSSGTCIRPNVLTNNEPQAGFLNRPETDLCSEYLPGAWNARRKLPEQQHLTTILTCTSGCSELQPFASNSGVRRDPPRYIPLGVPCPIRMIETTSPGPVVRVQRASHSITLVTTAFGASCCPNCVHHHRVRCSKSHLLYMAISSSPDSPFSPSGIPHRCPNVMSSKGVVAKYWSKSKQLRCSINCLLPERSGKSQKMAKQPRASHVGHSTYYKVICGRVLPAQPCGTRHFTMRRVKRKLCE